MDEPLKFKIAVIGDWGVGKTSLLSQYILNSFNIRFLNSLGLGIDHFTKTVTVGGKKAELEIWDSSGREDCYSLFPFYYRNALAVLLVYDVTKYESFENTLLWYHDVAKHVHPFAVFILVGNKCDLKKQRTVPREIAEEFAESYSMLFIEVSAKKNKYIKEGFEIIADEIYSRMLEGAFNKPEEECTPNKEAESSSSTNN